MARLRVVGDVGQTQCGAGSAPEPFGDEAAGPRSIKLGLAGLAGVAQQWTGNGPVNAALRLRIAGAVDLLQDRLAVDCRREALPQFVALQDRLTMIDRQDVNPPVDLGDLNPDVVFEARLASEPRRQLGRASG